MYAIECNNGEKGTLVDGYGTTADTDTANFMLNVKNKNNLQNTDASFQKHKLLCNRFLFNLKNKKRHAS
jgi:hypothetical protein